MKGLRARGIPIAETSEDGTLRIWTLPPDDPVLNGRMAGYLVRVALAKGATPR